MADEKQPSSWVVQVKGLLKKKIEISRAITPRLPRAMMNGKPEAYIPQILSLGPYHHRTLKDAEGVFAFLHRPLSDISLMESHKLKSAQVALDGKSDQIVDDLYAIIMKRRNELEKFYDWNIDKDFLEVTAEAGEDQSQHFGWMLILDALFLFKLLEMGFNFNSDVDSDHPAAHPPAMATVRCDIVKSENQIPLFVLRELEKALKPNPSDEEKLDGYVRRRISTDLNCFDVYGENIEEVVIEHHLLGCMHTYVSSFREIQNVQNLSSQRQTLCQWFSTMFGNVVAAVGSGFCPHPAKHDQDDFLRRYNAEELLKAGIKIKSFKQVPGKITFNKHSHTLFLPRIIVIDTYTEVMLRNLLALEFYDANPVKHVTRYVELMDCLIDTPEDVRLLRGCGVIVRKSMMITDKYVADMWNDMCKPFFAGLMEPSPEMKSQIREVLIHSYYKSKLITEFREFRKEHLSSLWKAIALLVGILVLALDLTQTVCVFRECQPK